MLLVYLRVAGQPASNNNSGSRYYILSVNQQTPVELPLILAVLF